VSAGYVPADYAGPRPEASAYDAAYAGVPNWDIGRPQRAFVRLAEAGFVRGPVLDVGCGTGELSLFLAGRGHEVLGVDISPRAIATAREKARWRRNPARFLVWDALALDGLARAGLRFRTVVDCATFHVLRASDRDRYVAGLGTVLEPGGLFCVLGDARPDPRREYGLSPAELRARFRASDGWRVRETVETGFERRYSANRAYLGLVERTR
jgi:SAM-dependent methyltransferase